MVNRWEKLSFSVNCHWLSSSYIAIVNLSIWLKFAHFSLLVRLIFLPSLVFASLVHLMHHALLHHLHWARHSHFQNAHCLREKFPPTRENYWNFRRIDPVVCTLKMSLTGSKCIIHKNRIQLQLTQNISCLFCPWEKYIWNESRLRKVN